MSIARVTELSAISEQGFEDAINQAVERVMNSIRNGLGMRETEIAREPSRP